MKLWKIERTDECDYDQFDAAIVAAETEEAARKTNPGGPTNYDFPHRTWSDWVDSVDKVKAELIGEAVPGTAAGVVLASFNAG